MTASRYTITERLKNRVIEVARLADFGLGDNTEMAPQNLFSQAGWSLYTIEIEAGVAVFVRLPAQIDLSAAPFTYAAQYEHAVELATVPLETFVAMGADLPDPNSTSILFSTGRCGSTLASRILAKVPGVYSLSEPDCLTALVFARHHLADEMMRALLVATVRSLGALAPQADHIVIKPRSEQSFQIAQVAAALPNAHLVFMYRDAVSYVNSMQRLIQRVSGNPDFLNDPEMAKVGWYIASGNAPEKDKAAFLAPGASDLTGLEVLTLAWTLRMKEVRDARATGIAITPLHYADLTGNRRDETTKLFTAFGIDLSHLERGLEGFEKDAHEGSATSNATPAADLSDAQRAEVLAILQRWGAPDYLEGRLDG